MNMCRERGERENVVNSKHFLLNNLKKGIYVGVSTDTRVGIVMLGVRQEESSVHHDSVSGADSYF